MLYQCFSTVVEHGERAKEKGNQVRIWDKTKRRHGDRGREEEEEETEVDSLAPSSPHSPRAKREGRRYEYHSLARREGREEGGQDDDDDAAYLLLLLPCFCLCPFAQCPRLDLTSLSPSAVRHSAVDKVPSAILPLPYCRRDILQSSLLAVGQTAFQPNHSHVILPSYIRFCSFGWEVKVSTKLLPVKRFLVVFLEFWKSSSMRISISFFE